MDIAAALNNLFLLTYVAVGQTVALEQIFDTQLYQKWLGFGPDGKGSRLFSKFELRPWISAAVGLFISFRYGLQFVAPAIPKLLPPGAEGLLVDMIITGLIIGGGTKAIKGIAKQFGDASREIKGNLA